ncbi:MAG: ferredoxin [Deltaproteobacteria bacterium]|nr:ferredoxin [Deltaproteobacteria bacterium]
MKRPVVDMADCVDCDTCLELCPEVFRRNDLGGIQVADLSQYPEEQIEEVIKNCPGDCIHWEQG